jgi:hypothetical protein
MQIKQTCCRPIPNLINSQQWELETIWARIKLLETASMVQDQISMEVISTRLSQAEQ